MSNLRQCGLVWHMYAEDWKATFPHNGDTYYGDWSLLTIPVHAAIRDGGYGVKAGKVFYCPNFSKVYTFPGAAESYWSVPLGWTSPNSHRIAYAIYANQYYAFWYNTTLGNNLPPPEKTTDPDLARLPLMFDETAVSGGADFTITFHRRNNTPLGGNALYGDGHVQWRNWGEMILVMYAGGGPGTFDRYY